jgi:hypothetical protein
MKTGERECRERPQRAELLVHHNTLKLQDTYIPAGGRERRIQEVWKMGIGEANWTRGARKGQFWRLEQPGSPKAQAPQCRANESVTRGPMGTTTPQ